MGPRNLDFNQYRRWFLQQVGRTLRNSGIMDWCLQTDRSYLWSCWLLKSVPASPNSGHVSVCSVQDWQRLHHWEYSCVCVYRTRDRTFAQEEPEALLCVLCSRQVEGLRDCLLIALVLKLIVRAECNYYVTVWELHTTVMSVQFLSISAVYSVLNM